MYTTEYRRSFANKNNWFSSGMNYMKRQDNNPSPEISSPRPNVNDVEKCSVGIQANVDSKRVHFEPDPVHSQVIILSF